MIFPNAPAKINETAKISVLGDCFLIMSQSQYAIPKTARILNMVKTNFPVVSEMGRISLSLVPQAAPSFSMKRILNQLKTSCDYPNTKFVLIYILLIWSTIKTKIMINKDFFKFMLQKKMGQK